MADLQRSAKKMMQQVATFSKPEEAEMLRAFLEGSGIDAVVRDSHTVTTDWALSNAIGGVKVDVPSEDAERALMLLREFSPSTSAAAREKKRTRHSLSRYVKIAALLSIAVLVFIATTVGFRGDVPPAMLVISAFGIGAGVAAFCALYDL